MPPKSLPVIEVSADIYRGLNTCVHCGLCLPACPTYAETFDECDSPRGRIHLMKALADGKALLNEAVFEHLDRCLVCRACETACPSGVVYHKLIEAVRPQVAQGVLGPGRRMRDGKLQWMIDHILTHPQRFAAATAPVRWARKLGLGGVVRQIAGTLGAGARDAMDMLPGEKSVGPAHRRALATFTPAAGAAHRGGVLLLRGCVGSVLSGEVNAACITVLTRNGFDVHLAAVDDGGAGEGCCGAMAAHANHPEMAQEQAARLVETLFLRSGQSQARKGADFIVSPIAGCGAQLKVLHEFVPAALVEKAREVSGRVRDICQLLAEAGIEAPRGRLERAVAYHDPCHLAHAQGITEPPRQLLAMIPGLKVAALEESDMCCGAAGTYSLNQGELAARLGQRKARHILAGGVQEVATANIGCALQIARHLERAGRPLPVRHVVEFLAESYGQE